MTGASREHHLVCGNTFSAALIIVPATPRYAATGRSESGLGILGTAYSMPLPFAEQVARVAIPLAGLRTRLRPLQ